MLMLPKSKQKQDKKERKIDPSKVMPVKQEISDSIQISVEVKYIKKVAGQVTVTRYPTRDELRGEVERLLWVVRDTRTERKEAVFGSIESKLESVLVNLQKVKHFSGTKEVEKFKKDLIEGEKHVRKCFSDPETYCWCIETSKPKFLTEELQRFDNCLESFDQILVNMLQVEARDSSDKNPEEVGNCPEKLASTSEKGVLSTGTLSVSAGSGSGDSNLQKASDSFEKEQFEKRDSSVNIPEKTRKTPEELANTPGKVVLSTRSVPAAPTPAGSGSGDLNLQKSRDSLTKAQLDTRDVSVNIPEKTRKTHEELANAPRKSVSSTRTLPAEPAPSISSSEDSNLYQEQQKPVLKRSTAMSKTEESNPSENNSTATLDLPLNGLKEKHERSNLTENKDVRSNNFTRSSILLDMSNESNKEKYSGSAAAAKEWPDYTTLTAFMPDYSTAPTVPVPDYTPTPTALVPYYTNPPTAFVPDYTPTPTVSVPDYAPTPTAFVPDYTPIQPMFGHDYITNPTAFVPDYTPTQPAFGHDYISNPTAFLPHEPQHRVAEWKRSRQYF
ncbi:hypothetical protein M5689_012585 [Euphorbia peplus]|nr:hypothetical protein M5689_012585 [Euphorbia peplus]